MRHFVVGCIVLFTIAGTAFSETKGTQRESPSPAAAAPPANQNDATFLVGTYRGYVLLGPDGKETGQLDSKTNAAGAFSPDGKWVAFAKSDPDGTAVIQSRLKTGTSTLDRIALPMVWGKSGTSFLPIWSSDSKKLLICERHRDAAGAEVSRYRMYNLATKTFSELKAPSACWVNDWSADGKRLLTTVYSGPVGIAWVDTDGTGEPAYVTSKDVVAYRARLSPDGRRVLCMLGPKPPKGKRSPTRLCVIDLVTKKRTVVDEPGATDGYCWSPDGSRIAYTWQRSLDKPVVTVRETKLITCRADGSDRKIVASRRREVSADEEQSRFIFYWFTVLDWR